MRNAFRRRRRKKGFLLESTLLIGSTRSAALYYVKSWEEKDVKDESDGALMELSNSISHLWAKHVDCVCVCNEIETKLRSNDWSSIKKRADGCQVTHHERETTTTTKCAVYFISFYGSLFSGWHTFSAKDFLFVTKELALFCFDYLFIELV